jgi:hypothetical protein
MSLTDLSASTAAADTVFVGFGAGQLWEHEGAVSSAGSYEVTVVASPGWA